MITCTCRPADGFHQYGCIVSQQMRRERIEAGKVRTVDPTKRARVARQDPWQDERVVNISLTPQVGIGGGQTMGSCGWFRHDWDDGHDPGGACDTYTVRYTCRACGKTKDRGGA